MQAIPLATECQQDFFFVGGNLGQGGEAVCQRLAVGFRGSPSLSRTALMRLGSWRAAAHRRALAPAPGPGPGAVPRFGAGSLVRGQRLFEHAELPGQLFVAGLGFLLPLARRAGARSAVLSRSPRTRRQEMFRIGRGAFNPVMRSSKPLLSASTASRSLSSVALHAIAFLAGGGRIGPGLFQLDPERAKLGLKFPTISLVLGSCRPWRFPESPPTPWVVPGSFVTGLSRRGAPVPALR